MFSFLYYDTFPFVHIFPLDFFIDFWALVHSISIFNAYSLALLSKHDLMLDFNTFICVY